MKHKSNKLILFLTYFLFPLGMLFKIIQHLINFFDQHPIITKSLFGLAGLASAEKISTNSEYFASHTTNAINIKEDNQISNSKIKLPPQINLQFKPGLTDNQQEALKKIINFYKNKINTGIAGKGMQLILAGKYRVGFCTKQICQAALGRFEFNYTTSTRIKRDGTKKVKVLEGEFAVLIPYITLTDGRINLEAYFGNNEVSAFLEDTIKHELIHAGMLWFRIHSGQTDNCPIPKRISSDQGSLKLKEVILKDLNNLLKLYQDIINNKSSIELDELAAKLKDIPYKPVYDNDIDTSVVNRIEQEFSVPSVQNIAIKHLFSDWEKRKYQCRANLSRDSLVYSDGAPILIYRCHTQHTKYSHLLLHIYRQIFAFTAHVNIDSGDNKAFCREAAAEIGEGREVKLLFPEYTKEYEKMCQSYGLSKNKKQLTNISLFPPESNDDKSNNNFETKMPT